VHSVFSDQYIVTTPFPESYPVASDSLGVQKLNLLQEIVTKIRVMRSENGVAPDKKCKVIVKSSDNLSSSTILENEVSLLQLARLESIRIDTLYEIQKTDSVSHFTKGEIVLPLEGLIDVAKEKARLEKELQKSELEKEKLEIKLSNPGFLSKAAPEVVEKERDKLKTLIDKVEVLKKGIQN
ncbi:valine--tRNA ligase, partial [Leptospira borgpetersenii serovar Hardjo-bovis]|nr:valine--tRNA ligase [Leptospira borgpetersenii serovar Hardjo-bovis]